MKNSALIIHVTHQTRKRASSVDPADVPHRDVEDIEDEARGLTKAIDLKILAEYSFSLKKIIPSTYLGKGAVEQITMACEELNPSVVFINAALSPIQQRNLERAIGAKIIDRTGLILEIFGERAQTKEGRIQVDLAALSYQRSRLVKSWTHLERQRGGAGFMGGPGETQIELDRRIIDDTIKRLKKQLTKLRENRQLQARKRSKAPYPIIALVGYTNAGKSTLFNRLTNSNVYVEDLRFATLDPTLRNLKLPSGRQVILSDTVGFISDLPTYLIEAFRATLEQVIEADIILHVRDASADDTEAQKRDVLNTLEGLKVNTDKDGRIIEVLNKQDLISNDDTDEVHVSTDNRAYVSALTGEGCQALLQQIEYRLSKHDVVFSFKPGKLDGQTRAWLYENGEVLKESDVLFEVKLDSIHHGRFEARFGDIRSFA